MFMERGEKLTDDAIWNDRWGPGSRYVLWPRGEFWDVRFMQVKNNKLEWIQVADEPFKSRDAAWQVAYADWEKRMEAFEIIRKTIRE